MNKLKKEFTEKVEELSEQNIFSCYQCGKCSAGCPIVDFMDFLPNQVIRLVQLGEEDVLDSKTIWLCASCFTCLSRCPRGIDLSRVMEALRIMVLRNGLDHVDISEVPDAPQQALVSALRKFGGR
ncbi:MAG: 4Fe-4S dicluster domain-containing protein [Candidatus Syntropharchaeia archaeon]